MTLYGLDRPCHVEQKLYGWVTHVYLTISQRIPDLGKKSVTTLRGKKEIAVSVPTRHRLCLLLSPCLTKRASHRRCLWGGLASRLPAVGMFTSQKPDKLQNKNIRSLHNPIPFCVCSTKECFKKGSCSRRHEFPSVTEAVARRCGDVARQNGHTRRRTDRIYVYIPQTECSERGVLTSTV